MPSRFSTDALHFVAKAGEYPGTPQLGSVARLSEQRIPVRAFLERRVIHLPDHAAPSVLEEFPDIVNRPSLATLTVPLVRGEGALGVLTVGRMRAMPYSPREIALIQ